MVRKIAVWLTSKIGLYFFFVRIETRMLERKMRKNFLLYGEECLLQADKAFRSVNARLFINFGTLLGAYREHNFIQHDFDLDVGYMYNEKPENIIELLQKFGFSHKRQFYVKETGLITEDMFEYKGVQIDFFVYFEKGEDFYCYIGRRHETKPAIQANKTDGFPCRLSYVPATEFQEIDFLEHKFYAPVKAKQWLTDIYGASFMTPIKQWSEFDHKTRIVFHNERLYRKEKLSK
jgi:hypothetical protein